MRRRLEPEALRRDALERVDQLVKEELRGRKIDVPLALASRFGPEGWKVPVEFSQGTLGLLLLVDKDFPFSLPRVAVPDGPDLLSWPHLEPHGLLCSLPNSTSVDFTEPEEVVWCVLKSTCGLIEDNLAALPSDDFREEFLSYWSYSVEGGAKECVSIVRPRGPSRLISVWRGAKRLYFGDSADELGRWLSNRFGEKKERFDLGDAWLVWLPEPWTPQEFPDAGGDLLAAISTHAEGLEDLDQLLRQRRRVTVLAGAETSAGSCFGAISFARRDRSDQRWARRGQRRPTKGFRPGKVPRQLLRARFFSHGHLSRHKVERADPPWVHGRDQNGELPKLRGQPVAIIGAGALGSNVARLLCQAGVDTLTVIDGDLLEWANVGRHELGGSAVGRGKASALATALLQRFPHAAINSHDREIGVAQPELMDEVLTSRIVLALTGNWTLEAALNMRWVQRDNVPDLVVGWMEAHALAAHSVYLTSDPFNGCLQCGRTPVGEPRVSAIEWIEDQTREIPACGGTFVPFGPVNLAFASALVAEQCIDVLAASSKAASEQRTWLAREDRVRKTGGKWNSSWLETRGDPGAGGCFTSQQWSRDPECVVCSLRSS